VAIAAFLIWVCTAAAGGYLLANGTRLRPDYNDAGGRPPEPSHAGAPRPPAGTTSAPGTATAARPRRDKDRFDPPSLTRAKNEPLPGLRSLAEFTHPALAIIGLGFWLAYVMSRDRVFAAIGLGVLLGAICAGLTWAASNARAARRLSAAAAEGDSPAGGDSGDAAPAGADAALWGTDALSFRPRALILHVAGAAVTLLIVVLIAARV
jgi:hypothetical protein